VNYKNSEDSTHNIVFFSALYNGFDDEEEILVHINAFPNWHKMFFLENPHLASLFSTNIMISVQIVTEKAFFEMHYVDGLLTKQQMKKAATFYERAVSSTTNHKNHTLCFN